jgi:hypothetical protein
MEVSMPNGGSDCCGTCWFNAKNKGEAGYEHSGDPEPDFCKIRDLSIDDPFYTYCANHPHRNPGKIEIPIGPVFTGDSTGRRDIWQPSPDTEAVRSCLLDLLSAIVETPDPEYPIGIYLDDVVIWQLGEFKEARAVPDLERIAAFDPSAQSEGPLVRDRSAAVHLAGEALAKIRGEPGQAD